MESICHKLDLKTAVLKITLPSGHFGSGFLPAPKLFLTAFHVIDELPEGTRPNLEGPVKLAKLIRVSKADDLALFSLEEEGEEYLESISLNTPEEWEELCAVGFPQGMLKRIGKTYSTNWQDQFAYQFSSNKSSHFYGISGAPLVKQDREVTGMIIKADDNILVSTTPMVINNFLEGKTGFNCPESASMTDCIAEEEKNFALEIETTSSPYLQYLGFLDHTKKVGREKAFAPPYDLLLEKSAQGGYPPAQFLLGVILLSMEEEGLNLIEQSAEAGYYEAMAYLCHNRVKSGGSLECLLELARNYGMVREQRALGSIYSYGLHGNEQDKELGQMYFSLAVAQGDQVSLMQLVSTNKSIRLEYVGKDETPLIFTIKIPLIAPL